MLHEMKNQKLEKNNTNCYEHGKNQIGRIQMMTNPFQRNMKNGKLNMAIQLDDSWKEAFRNYKTQSENDNISSLYLIKCE